MSTVVQYCANAAVQNTVTPDISNAMEHLAAATAAECIDITNLVSANVALSNANLTLQKKVDFLKCEIANLKSLIATTPQP